MVKALRISLTAALLMSGARASEAAVTPSGLMAMAIAAITRGSAVGFDPVNRVYLTVSTYGPLQGRFVDSSGTPLGVQFPIQASVNFTHFPSVAYSPDVDGGAGGFLVVWHESDMPTGTSVHTRVVSFSKGGATGLDNVVSVEGSYWERNAPVAYSTRSHEFLIAYPLNVGRGIRAVRTNIAGAAVAAPFTIAVNGQYEEYSSVAYCPVTDQFLVVYEGYSDSTRSGFIAGRAVQAGTNAAVGTAVPVYAGGADYISAVVFNPSTNQYLAVWYRDAGGGVQTILGRVINTDLTMPGNVVPISSLWKAYDGLGLAYNNLTQTSFMVSHDGRGLPTSVEDGGVEISANGAPVDNGFAVTSSPDVKPNFYPKIAASTTDPNWLVVTSHNFQYTATRLLTGTGTFVPPAPNPVMSVDSPGAGVLQQPFVVAGWAADLGSTSGPGVDVIHVWAWPINGGAPRFLGAVGPSVARGDVGSIFGAQFTSSGFGLLVNSLPGGTYDIAAYMHSTVAQAFNLARAVRVTVSDPVMSVDTPGPGGIVSRSGFAVAGWALDRGAPGGAGVDAVHVWAVAVNGGAAYFLGGAAYGGARGDVGGAYGAQFTNSGFNLWTSVLAPGAYYLVVYSHSAVTGTFNNWQVVPIVVQ